MMVAAWLMMASPVPIYSEDKHDCSAEIVKDNELRLTPEDIKSAQMGFAEHSGSAVINLQFTEQGNARFIKVQQGRVGKSIALCFNDRLLANPILHEYVLGAEVQISGGYTIEEATDLANLLNDVKQAD